MSDPGTSSAERRYRRACEECAAAERNLEAQRLRPGRQRSEQAGDHLPVLDPQHEAAADRLDAAERELREAWALLYEATGAGKQS